MNYKLTRTIIKCNKCNIDKDFKYSSSLIGFNKSNTNAKIVLSIILLSFITDFLFMYIILADFAHQNPSYKNKKMFFPYSPSQLRSFFTFIDNYLSGTFLFNDGSNIEYSSLIDDEIKNIYETFKSLCDTENRYTFIYKEEPYLKIRQFVKAYISNLEYELDDVLDKLKRNFKMEYGDELVSLGGESWLTDLINIHIQFDVLFNRSLVTIGEHLNHRVYFDAYLYERRQLLNIKYSNVPVCFVYYFINEHEIRGIRSSFIYTVIKKYCDPCLLSLGDKTIEATKKWISKDKGPISVYPVMNNKPWKDKLIKSGIFNVS